MANNKEKIESLKNEIKGLKEKLKDVRANTNEFSKLPATDLPPVGDKQKIKRTLKGHLAKIYSTAWAQIDNLHLVSASQDGKLLVWDALTTNKTHAIHLRSNWVMACDYSPDSIFVASGGLDNICSIFSLKPEANKDGPIKAARELNAHIGYISSCKFISDSQILTAAGDWTCILWDIPTSSRIQEFKEHGSDVMCVSLHPDKKTFVSGSCDNTCRVWDVNTGKCTQVYHSGEQDVNTVSHFPNGNAFVSGSEDGISRLYDTRAERELQTYSNDTKSAVTSSGFSSSGRYLFTGCNENTVQVYDTLSGKRLWALEGGHEMRVSCLALNVDGTAICTGSWDNLLKIWA